jgi:hypothetical protein
MSIKYTGTDYIHVFPWALWTKSHNLLDKSHPTGFHLPHWQPSP